MFKQTAIETDFYLLIKMAGIKHEYGEVYSFRGNKYKARVRRLEAPLIQSVGGKVRAYKLLRHAMMVHYITKQPGHEHIGGLIAPSLEAVTQQHPMMRAMYEQV